MTHFEPNQYFKPNHCAEAIRDWAEKSLASNRYATVGPGLVDFDGLDGSKRYWQIPVAVRLYSPSKETIFRSSCTDINAAQFNLNAGVILDGFELQNTAPYYEQSMTCGFGGDNRSDKPPDQVQPGDVDLNNCTAILRHCRLSGWTHTLYTWRGVGNRIIFDDGAIDGCRFIAGIGSSGSGRCAVMEINRSSITGKYQPCTYDPLASQIGQRLHGAWIRGGEMHLRDVMITLVGSGPYTHPINGQPQPQCLNVRGIWMPETGGAPGHEGGNPDARCTAERVTVRIFSNGSAAWHDAASGSGIIELVGGTGSVMNKFKTAEIAPGKVIVRAA